MSAHERIAKICTELSLTLAGCLAFLVPFDAARNIDLQGLLLVVSGGLAWIALLLAHSHILKLFDRLGILLAIFAACCLVSLFVNPHIGYDITGAPYIRLGTAGLLASIGIGLLARTIPPQRLLTGLYLLISSLAVVSLPYSWLRLDSLVRIGGVFAQADVFACFLGGGLLLGLEVARQYPTRRKPIFCVQGFLGLLLLLTQTRAVLLLVIILGLLWLWQTYNVSLIKLALCVISALLLLGMLAQFAPGRLTNVAYASQSLHYRLTLQNQALRATRHSLWGYGPGNLADALDCEQLSGKQLQATCRQGYFFNSSHNVFLDRVLAIGWLGGLSYLALVLLAIYRGLRGSKEVRIFGYALLLIAGYYLTNVTSVTLELMVWVLAARCLFSRAEA